MSEVLTPYRARRSHSRLVLAGWALMAFAYASIFYIFGSGNLGSSVLRAVINVVPAALLSLAVVYLVETFFIGRGWPRQVLCHLGLSVLFSLLWYAGIQTGYGLRDGWLTNGLSGRPLNAIALTWQLFQGVTLYAVAALFSYARHYKSNLATAEAELVRLEKAAKGESPSPAQILVKEGRTLIPVRLDDIQSISGVKDYTEIRTRDRQYLSTTSLSSFETRLPKADFLRVHRSHLVRLGAIVAVEPAGDGRLSVHFSGDHSVLTSRAGAKVLKDTSL